MQERFVSACLASGIAIALLFAVGFVVLAGFLPPPAPTLSPAEVATYYQAHSTRTLVGTFVIMTAMAMLAPWGTALAVRLREGEGSPPLFTYMQLVNCAVSTLVVVLCPMFWAAAAYRPFDTDPQIMRVINDIAWFLVLAPWPPFTFWLVAVGFAILRDRRAQPAFPAWTAYLSFWAGVLFVPAGAVLIFKTGPFAWNGLIAFYIPVIAFFGWLMVMSLLGARASLRAPATVLAR